MKKKENTKENQKGKEQFNNSMDVVRAVRQKQKKSKKGK